MINRLHSATPGVALNPFDE
jgi:hypothetical protein